MAGDARFHLLLREIGKLHDKKQADYGQEGDPFANVRASEDFGISGWIGCMMRANDKMRRLQTAAKGSELQNEGIEDSLMDLAVYSLIALILFQEEQGEITTSVPDCGNVPNLPPSTRAWLTRAHDELDEAVGPALPQSDLPEDGGDDRPKGAPGSALLSRGRQPVKPGAKTYDTTPEGDLT